MGPADQHPDHQAQLMQKLMQLTPEQISRLCDRLASVRPSYQCRTSVLVSEVCPVMVGPTEQRAFDGF